LSKQLAINRCRLWTFGRSAGRTADGARPPSGQRHSAAGWQTFTYSNPLCRQSLDGARSV